MRGRVDASLGRAGEFYAAYKLQIAGGGLSVSHIDNTCDLHVTLPSKRVLRVEVKTAGVISRYGSYRFNRGGSDAEFFVLVALRENLLRIYSASDMKNVTTTLRPADFTQQAEDDDIAGLLLL